MLLTVHRTSHSPSRERVVVQRGSETASWRDVLGGWCQDDSFADAFSATLAASSFSAFFWECPPLTIDRLSAPFECMLIESTALVGVRADARAFSAHFAGAGAVATFSNLRGDARLVAPCPGGDQTRYAHIAAFVRSAASGQQRALWGAVGSLVLARVGHAPLWLSTSGLGVYWLHVRLDQQPKYYTHRPYRRA